MFDFKNSTKNFNFKNSLEVVFFFSRTDWYFQIKNRLKFYLMNRISNTDWNIYFKRSLKGLISRTTGSKLEVLFQIRLEFFQEQTGSFDFFSL